MADETESEPRAPKGRRVMRDDDGAALAVSLRAELARVTAERDELRGLLEDARRAIRAYQGRG